MEQRESTAALHQGTTGNQENRSSNNSESRAAQGKWGSHRNKSGAKQFHTAAATASSDAGGNQRVAAATAVNKQNYKTRTCLFCKSVEHVSSRCSANLTLEQRKKTLDKLRRCHVCFRPNHSDLAQCEGTKSACAVCQDRRHYTTMHPPGGAAQTTAAAVAGSQDAGGGSGGSSSEAAPNSSLLLTASAFVECGGSKLPVRIFLDQGCSITFVDPAFIKRLPSLTPLHRAEINLNMVGNSMKISPARYRITLLSTLNGKRVDMFAYEHAFGVDPTVTLTTDALATVRQFNSKYQLADRSLLGDLTASPLVMLVGFDQFYRIAHVGKELPLADGLVARDTCLGWVVGGPMATANVRGEVASIVTHCCSATVSKPARDLERLWQLEGIGVKEPNADPGMSADEKEALNQFNESITYDGNKYTVAMPRRPTLTLLANNKSVALTRLEGKRRSLRRDENVYHRYNKEVLAFVADGHADEVSNFNIDDDDACDGTYYMPHHQVVTEAAGGAKWRIVFDCSSSAPRKSSLNAHLLPGPNLNPDLVKLLINFRLQKVALSADIVRACIQIDDNDRPLFRFLWQGPADPQIRCFQMRKVTWGLHLAAFCWPRRCDIISRRSTLSPLQVGQSLYHDDLLRSFETDSDAITFIQQLSTWLDPPACAWTSGKLIRYWSRDICSTAATKFRPAIQATAHC